MLVREFFSPCVQGRRSARSGAAAHTTGRTTRPVPSVIMIRLGRPLSPSTQQTAVDATGACRSAYNYQVASWVWGIEADGSWGNIKSKTNLLETEPGAIETLAIFDQKLTSFGTVRGRLGYTWNWGM